MKPIQPMEPMPLGTLERIKNNNIIQAWLVLILALLFGSSLAGIQITLGPKIEENKINETREKVPELILGKEAALKMTEAGQSLNVMPHSFVVEKPGRKAAYNVYEALDTKKNRLGWVVKAKGQGYADKIELLFGLDAAVEKITGVFVLEQKETPGLGNKIVTDEWRGQYIGKSTAKPVGVIKGGGAGSDDINAITGATISSKAVTDIINSAIADIKGPLAEKAKGGK
ncbi:Ion-translocating oxidoreductase complex, subunit G [Desulfonema limicola]|uniref:Ion-translocating oxidoreductase complex subunit G n=1 Tax=Desulfonema limicola TaxID=45656 RepID=A0A975B6C7_9BACT|nr:FMN-binding protein [Desulfonema limicola]QTA79606.1 Ion-translocating oxidoreductase complex, subunit G [Desulfonema limicola]